MLAWLFVAANSKTKPRRPEPIRRPWQQQRSMTVGHLVELGQVVSVGR